MSFPVIWCGLALFWLKRGNSSQTPSPRRLKHVISQWSYLIQMPKRENRVASYPVRRHTKFLLTWQHTINTFFLGSCVDAAQSRWRYFHIFIRHWLTRNPAWELKPWCLTFNGGLFLIFSKGFSRKMFWHCPHTSSGDNPIPVQSSRIKTSPFTSQGQPFTSDLLSIIF